MGQRYIFTCDACNYQKDVQVGVGINGRNPDVISRCLRGDDALRWKALYEQGDMADFGLSQHLCHCKNCEELVETLEVDIHMKGGERIMLGRRCPVCGGSVDDMDYQSGIQCPKCKNHELSKRLIGFWD